MARKLNVCIISREFPPDTDFGGISTFSVDTALMLKSQGHNVTVFSQSLGPSCIVDFHGVQVYKIKVPRPFNNYWFLPGFVLVYNWVVYHKIMKCHKKNPFDIIDVPDHLAEGLFVSIFTNIPIVTRLHTPYALIAKLGLNNTKISIATHLIKYMEKMAVRASDVLYTPCDDMLNRCNELFDLTLCQRKKFSYPLNLETFNKSDNLHAGPLRILFVGRLEQRKGIEIIADAFSRIALINPGITLTIIGNDTNNITGNISCKTFLKNKFLKNQCDQYVTFLQPVQLENLPKVFHVHDIVWVPSVFDNYPLVCLEAMACEKAVIVSDIGGLPEIVMHEHTGLVCKVGNVESLVQETLKLCYSPDLIKIFGKNARSFIEENCSRDVIYKNTLDLYDMALNNKANDIQ